MDITVLDGAEGTVQVEELAGDKRRVSVQPTTGLVFRRSMCVTSYPLSLIREIHAAKGLTVCQEIMREDDPRLVEHAFRHAILGYLDASAFAGKRILDFGCGSCRRARSSASSWRKKSCDSRGCAPSTWGEAACNSSARPPAIRFRTGWACSTT
jgi:hypothetical protein